MHGGRGRVGIVVQDSDRDRDLSGRESNGPEWYGIIIGIVVYGIVWYGTVQHGMAMHGHYLYMFESRTRDI